MTKRHSVTSRVLCETENVSVYPILIVLEVSLSSINGVPIVLIHLREYLCISADKFHICDLLQGPSLLIPVVSGNVRKLPEASLQPLYTLRDIRIKFTTDI